MERICEDMNSLEGIKHKEERVRVILKEKIGLTFKTR